MCSRSIRWRHGQLILCCGLEAFKEICSYRFIHPHDDKCRFAMVDYLLKNTVVEKVSVARSIIGRTGTGICVIDLDTVFGGKCAVFLVLHFL